MAIPDVRQHEGEIAKCYTPCNILLHFEIYFCNFSGLGEYNQTNFQI